MLKLYNKLPCNFNADQQNRFFILNIFPKNEIIINLYAYCPHTVQLKYFKIENFGHVTNDAFIYLIQHIIV